MTEPQGEFANAEQAELVVEQTSLAGWKVLVALITLGVVTGAFLAVFGHSLRLFG